MNDYKELIEKLRMAGKWIKHDDGSEETYLLSAADCEQAADAIEQLVRERDAAVNWLPHQCNLCKHCHPANGIHCAKGGCADWKRRENWEWRGVQNE